MKAGALDPNAPPARAGSAPILIAAELDPTLSARIIGSSCLSGVRAGSALVLSGGRLLTVQDDAFTLVWIDPTTRSEEALVLHGTGEALSKAQKPDFEAAVLTEGDVVYVLGSGSTANRRWIARLDLPRKKASLTVADLLYNAVTEALRVEPNIEGAVLLGDVLRLFHRGSGRDLERNASATIDMPAAALDGGDAHVLAMRRYDLGSIGGIPLTFTDSAPLDGGRRALYIAVAEDTPDAIADGPVVGASIGVIEGDSARFARLLEADGSPCTRKPEGVTLDPGERSGFLVTDPDSPSEPAELCRFILEGNW